MTHASRIIRRYGPRLLLLAGVWAVMAVAVPEFRGTSSVFAVLENLPVLGLVALGLAVTIIAGELDLSVASVAAVAGVLAVEAASAGLVVALVAAVCFGAAFGAAQGWIIARTGISSLVFTIGTLILMRGLAYVLSSSKSVLLDDLAISDVLLVRYGVFSVGSIVACGVFLVVGLFLAYTRRGREVYAIGGGRPEAIAAGVSSTRPITLAFMISAACAALAGAIASLKGGSAAPANFADLLLLGAIVALIGGVRLEGGSGTAMHVLVGVGLMSVLTVGLTVGGVDASVAQIVTGGVLFIVIGLEFAASRIIRIVRPNATGAVST